MQRINTPDGNFAAGDPTTGVKGTVVSQAWMQDKQEELVGVVLAAGLKLDSTKSDQLLSALILLFASVTGLSTQVFDAAPAAALTNVVNLAQALSGAAETAVASGTANAIVLTRTVAAKALTDQMKVRFTAVANCTGAMTINDSGLGAKSFVGQGNTPFVGGEIVKGGEYEAIFNLAAGTYQLVAQSGGATQGSPALAGNHVAQAAQVPGLKQTWQNFVGSRSLGTGYTNTTAAPITVIVQAAAASQANAALVAYVNGVAIETSPGAAISGGATSILFVVPPGATYQVSNANYSLNLSAWFELRA